MKYFWLLIAGIVAAALAVFFGVVPGAGSKDEVWSDSVAIAPAPAPASASSASAPQRGVSWQPASGDDDVKEPDAGSAGEEPERSAGDAAQENGEPGAAEGSDGGSGAALSEVPPSKAPSPMVVAGAAHQQSPMLIAPGHVHQVPATPEPVASDVGADLDVLLGIDPESEEDAAVHAERLREAHLRALQELSDRYGIIAGEGTRERPYRIDWERLASASRVYRPREGLLEMPAFIQKLDGAFVELAGYTLFSWSGLQIDEILLTRYMWDGCCIGVPPTPFTAVETRLKEPIERKDVWAMRSGIFVGRFQVDPYVQGDWLIALYVMEDAEMQPVF